MSNPYYFLHIFYMKKFIKNFVISKTKFYSDNYVINILILVPFFLVSILVRNKNIHFIM